ncbi:MAG: hypothetical protein ACYC6Z_11175 [Thermoleophilia bacterium]
MLSGSILSTRRKSFPFLICILIAILFSLIFPLDYANASTDDIWYAQPAFPIVSGSGNHDIPKVDGDIVVWRDFRDSSPDRPIGYLYGKNLSGDGSEQRLSEIGLSGYLGNLDIKSKKVAYQIDLGAWEMCTRDLGADQNNLTASLPNCIAPGSAAQTITISPDGNQVAFDSPNPVAGVGNGIKQADFTLGEVSAKDSYASASEPFFSDWGLYYKSWDPYGGMYYSDVIKAPGGKQYPGPGCGSDTARSHVRVIGGMVYYQKKTGIGSWDLWTGAIGDPYSSDETVRCPETPLFDTPADRENLEFTNYTDENGTNHALIVWQENQNGNWHIYMKDLSTGQEVPVCVSKGNQENPAITIGSDGQPFIVWQDDRNSFYDSSSNSQVTKWDIYGTKLSSTLSLAQHYQPEMLIFKDDYVPTTVNLITDLHLSPEQAQEQKCDAIHQAQSDCSSILRTWQFDPTKNEQVTTNQLPANGMVSTMGSYHSPSYSDNPSYNSLDYDINESGDVNDGDFHINEYRAFRLGSGSLDYPATEYVRVVRESQGQTRTVIQYWFCYYYNDFWDFLDKWSGKHEGDWEMIQVGLDDHLKPEDAVYSQHTGGEMRTWDQVNKSPDNPDRPLVYVSSGGHANYFRPQEVPSYDKVPIVGKPGYPDSQAEVDPPNETAM